MRWAKPESLAAAVAFRSGPTTVTPLGSRSARFPHPGRTSCKREDVLVGTAQDLPADPQMQRAYLGEV